MFLFSPANNSVQEILTFNENKRSWFIDESVKSDGKMHLSTPIDPIFLGEKKVCVCNDKVIIYFFNSSTILKKILHYSSCSFGSTIER